MFAIAAMSRNGVIGRGSEIPWRIPEEFRWFRRMTLGSVVIMGRRTFESLPKPLDGRVTVVLTRHPERLLADEELKARLEGALVGAAAHRAPDMAQLSLPKLPRTEVRLVRGLESLERAGLTKSAWLCGGAQLYQQFLARCSDLYLSVIDRDVEGDAHFPPFEHLFDLAGVAAEFAEFRVLHYTRNETSDRREPDAGAAVAPPLASPPAASRRG
jgi:dihydrofolate reductase